MTVNGTELTKEKGGADMKKTATISAILAVVGFMAVYVALCYLVPGWRIKLEAPAMVYFAASLRHMAKTPFSSAMCRRLAAKYTIAGASSLMRQPGTK